VAIAHTKTECACEKCVTACQRTPGLFRPGEAEKAAAHLGIPFEEFKQQLMIDWWTARTGRIYYYVPRKVEDKPERVADWGRAFLRSPCVFLKDKRCSIHAAKPFECREAFLCETESKNLKPRIVVEWKRAGNPLKAEAEYERDSIGG
jgi:Fe-S-cluster containining protein